MRMKIVRVLVIGDEAVGKTAIIERYVRDQFLVKHMPTVINEYTKSVKNCQLHIRDSSGLKEFQNLRFLQYSNIDVVLICFNLATIGTLDNVTNKWMKEINQYCRDAIRILIGCKSDLETIINDALIIKMQSQLKFKSYVRCSAKTNENVDAAFDAVVNSYNVDKKLGKIKGLSKMK